VKTRIKSTNRFLLSFLHVGNMVYVRLNTHVICNFYQLIIQIINSFKFLFLSAAYRVYFISSEMSSEMLVNKIAN
jgi:hypothetical protein